jgi:hypothetical protein
MSLTYEQTIFVNLVQSMINNHETGFLVLDAAGGTGKSFVIDYIKKNITRDGGPISIMILAPTHKAASIIGAITIHRYLAAEKDIDESGKITFSFNKPQTKFADILIVDEASMVNTEMLDKFKQIAASEASIIIFCGDRYQIPPVNQQALVAESPIFSDEFKQHSRLCRFTVNMRSKDSLSNHWLQKFRSAVDTGAVVWVDRQPVIDCLSLFDNQADTVMLAWTNKQVACWNYKIRSYLFKDRTQASGFAASVLAKYYVGEVLTFSGFRHTGYDDIICVNPMLEDVRQKVTDFYDSKRPACRYYSSDRIKIVNTYMTTIYVPYFRCPHQDSKNAKLRKCSTCDTKGHNTSGHDIKYHVLIDEDKTTWLSPDDADEATIKHILAEYKAYCCKVRLRDIWRTYYAVQEILMPSINYSYASTVHKAQGSQWLNVIVDINNIRLCRDSVLSSKLQYTAVSRMRDLVQFV